ncbi:cytochrome P450 [Nocardioides sp.]|uniref:cytochrome P450 n=1 Tax=Nocardioides sp. TaxID=35761 RepID=UPI00356879A0
MRYDPFDADFQADPYPAYAWLREHDPVHRHVGDQAPPFWVLSRFADVWDAVRRPEDFSSASGLTFYADEIAQLGLAPTIVMLDPPVQTRLRGLIGRGFTPKRVADLEGEIREFARQRIATMERTVADGGTPDLHRDYATTIPTFVLARLLGVTEADRGRFDPWVSALTRLQNEGFAADALSGAEVIGEMFAFFSALIDQRREEPADDLIGALVAAELDGERLSDWDILGFCFVMVAGGNDTTGALISHGITLLDQHPDQRALLLDDPTLIERAVPEFLRLESSVQGLARTTTRAVRVGDVEIPAGEKVLMLYGAANRDTDEFGPDADVLDVRRDIARHLGFGTGPHFCIGSHLARLQARVAFEELLAAHPQVGADVAAGVRHPSAFTRGWETLPATGISAARG